MEEIDKVAADFQKLASCYHAVFTSDQGVAVLNHIGEMCAVSHLSGNQMMDSQATINPSEFMFIREGQDTVLRHIARMIKVWEDRT